MSAYVLFALFFAEIFLRALVEIREKKLFFHFKPFWLLRIIPILNDFSPLPEARVAPTSSRFSEAHERAHEKFKHRIIRNLTKLSFFFCMSIIIFVQLTEWKISLWEILLWFHFELGIFRLIYHGLCWNEENDADRFALKEVGKAPAQKALRELAKKEAPMSLLFAFLYREHPPAKRRLQEIL